jgi:hypothetical protein
MSQSLELERFTRNFSLPERPHGQLPEIPTHIGDMGELELMELYTEFMAWLNYAKAQLVIAEIDEERELNHLEYVKSATLISLWDNKSKGDMVTISKAKRDVDVKIQTQQEAYIQARAYRKLVDTVFDRCERGTQIISRELSRRISTAPQERRLARYAP